MILFMEKTHIKKIVELHKEIFKNFFLTELGEKFLHLFYESIVEFPYAIKMIYMCEKNIVGFIIGIEKPGCFYKKFLRRNFFKLFIILAPKGCKNFHVLRRILSSFKRESSTQKTDFTLMKSIELSLIGVHSQYRGQNIGKKLCKKFIEICKSQGYRYIYLFTDTYGNENTNRFYQKLGFEKIKEVKVYPNRTMNKYIYEIK